MIPADLDVAVAAFEEFLDSRRALLSEG
jgi:hypothetical protein